MKFQSIPGKLLVFILLLSLISSATHPVSVQSFSNSLNKLAISVKRINLLTNDIVFDQISNKIYASVSSSAGNYGNSIVSIDVLTGEIGTPVFIGSEPNKLALSDDGHYLYVGLDGAAAVRRFNVISHTAELQFNLGNGFCGFYRAEDMVVQKGNPNIVAISKSNSGCSPRHEGVSIYNNGFQLPTSTPGHTGSNVIEPSNLESVIYGYNNESTEFGFRVMSMMSSGIVVTSVTPNLVSGFNTDIRFDAFSGLIYATNGAVINPDTGSLIGTYNASGLVYPDSPAGRVYFISKGYGESSAQLKVFNQATFTPSDSFVIANVSGTPGSLLKTGNNKLAFRTSDGQIFFIQFLELNYSVFLPMIQKSCSIGICGQVTFNGNIASSVYLELRFYDGAGWSTIASTSTDSNGNYSFIGVPSLAPGKSYYVRYRNTWNQSDRLWLWATRVLTSYAGGSNVPIGNFDIANVNLVLPVNGGASSLPLTFQWMQRTATMDDSYELNLYDPTDGDPYFYNNPPLGYVNSYMLNSLPDGFSSNVPYAWDVWVYSPDGGHGISYESRLLTFSNTALGIPVNNPPMKNTVEWEELIHP